MRLVLDTNVVVAGLLWNGHPRRLLDLAINGDVTLFSSPALIDELAHTLNYPKFSQRIAPPTARRRLRH
jgi:putative PIN family toxin of toxin-antitoxin system